MTSGVFAIECRTVIESGLTAYQASLGTVVVPSAALEYINLARKSVVAVLDDLYDRGFMRGSEPTERRAATYARFTAVSARVPIPWVEDFDGTQLFTAMTDRNWRVPFFEELQHLLDTLSSREQDVLRSRFGLDGSAPQTLEEVGEGFGVTRDHPQDGVLRLSKNAIP